MKKDDRNKIKVPVKPKGQSFADPIEYEILKKQELNLTKARAFQFLELETFNGERGVRESHVQFLFDEAMSGRFVWHHVLLATAEFSGKVYRINGQHTCWMRVNFPDVKNEPACDVNTIHYRVDSYDQLKALYAAFDRAAPRTQAHIGTLLLMDTPAGREIPKSLIGRLIGGFRVHFSEDWNDPNGKRMRIEEVTSLIAKNHASLFNIVGHYLQIHHEDAVWLRRAAVIGAMFSTFDKNVQASDGFWGPVFSGIGIEKRSDPRWQLRRYCETHGHTIEAKGTEKVSTEQLYAVCLNMWNHWRQGNEISSVKTIDKRPRIRA